MVKNNTHKGFIHVYTGNGKGKTTAALGLALRAAGAGKKIFIAQFVKGMPYSELNMFEKIQEINNRQFGTDCFIVNQPTEQDIELAKNGLNETAAIIKSGKYDMIILDEACIAVYYKLFTSKELIKVVLSKPSTVEIIITGRYASEDLIEIADVVTEMKEIKHYYTRGVEARKGIEF